MPHVVGHKINGIVSPSVNQITDIIPKPWLEAWQRKLGFKKSDAIRDTAKELGLKVHEIFENYFKGQEVELDSITKPFLESLVEWKLTVGFESKLEWVEAHLESKQYLYHGSLDVAGTIKGRITLIDYKIKTKFPDYKTILNETAYAQLMGEDSKIGQCPKDFWILNFDPKTGKLSHALQFEIEEQWWNDFLTLRRAVEVARRADEFNVEHGVSKRTKVR